MKTLQNMFHFCSQITFLQSKSIEFNLKLVKIEVSSLNFKNNEFFKKL